MMMMLRAERLFRRGVVSNVKMAVSVRVNDCRQSVRFFSPNVNKKKTDADLDWEFKHVKRWDTALSVLTREGSDKFHDLRRKLGIGMFHALYIYTETHHPLLEKYGFNIFEFLEGAKMAYMKVRDIIYSTEFKQYANGEIESSELAEELREVTSEEVFNEYLSMNNTDFGGDPRLSILRDELVSVTPLQLECHAVENTPGFKEDISPSLFPNPSFGVVGAGVFGNSQPSSSPVKHHRAEKICGAGEEDEGDHTPLPKLHERKTMLYIGVRFDAATVFRDPSLPRMPKITQWQLAGDISLGDKMEWRIVWVDVSDPSA